MNLTQLAIRNFRPYYGETVIDFGAVADRPVSLIHGPNGYGKTSILLALQWCLYGHNRRKREAFEYFNTLARSEPGSLMQVRAEFQSGTKSYTVVRRIRGKNGRIETAQDLDNDEITFLEDGERYQGQDPVVIQQRINELLPQNASQFAFFDGEKIEVYSAGDPSEATREAIATVLGLHLFTQAKEDAEKLAYEVSTERQRLLGREQEYAKLAREIEQVEQDLRLARAQVEQRRDELKEMKGVEADLMGQLAAHEEARQIMREAEELRVRRSELETRRSALKSQMQEASASLYLDILAPVLTEQARKARLLADEQLRRAQEAARKAAVRDLADRIRADGRCICGRALDDESFRRLLNSLGLTEQDLEADDQPDGVDAQRLARGLEDALATIQSRESFASLVAKMSMLESDVDEIDTVIAAKEMQLEGSDEKTIQTLTEAIAKSRANQELLSREIGDLEGRIQDLGSYRDRLETQIRRLGGQIAGLEKLTEELDVLGATARAFDDIVHETSSARRNEIQEASTRYFKSITNKLHAYERLLIEDDFSFALEDTQGRRPPMQLISAGEKQVTALSFILGLNEFSQHEAPILMDTPMGRLDREHRKNIATVLRDLGRQVILLVTDTDTEFGVHEILAPAIGDEFEIVHDQATLTSTIARRNS
jgi:DNA sulfur modification protein DndD